MFSLLSKNNDNKQPIMFIRIEGDSLSDRKTLYKEVIFGCIPMAWISGLSKTSPKGRFTNGYTWSDDLAAKLGSDFNIKNTRKYFEDRTEKNLFYLNSADMADAILYQDKKLPKYTQHSHCKTAYQQWFNDHKKKYPKAARGIRNQNLVANQTPPQKISNSDIADALISDSRLRAYLRGHYSLDASDTAINYQGKPWLKTFCIGGLTAYDYSWKFTINLILFFTRLVVSTLTKMRDLLIKTDKNSQFTMQEKAETLIIEWSGANDLVTVNSHPTKEAVDKAIKARVDNVKKLIAEGYQHFLLFNLPNLALTPRFQNKSEEERKQAEDCVNYFNEELNKACEELRNDYAHCSIKSFDINKKFTDMYEHPERYGLDKNKLKTPFISTDDFKKAKRIEQIPSAKGYMFFDDLHPTADVHNQLAEEVYRELLKYYHLLEPRRKHPKKGPTEKELVACFYKHYERQLAEDTRSFWGSKKVGLKRDNKLSTILHHAFNEQGHRTIKVLKKLGWMDKEGNPVLTIPSIAKTIHRINKSTPTTCYT